MTHSRPRGSRRVALMAFMHADTFLPIRYSPQREMVLKVGGTPAMGPPKTITDAEITLAAYSFDDASTHFHAEDEEMRDRFPAPRLATLESAKAAVARWIAGHESGGPYGYAIKLQARNLVGGCELCVATESTAYISYWIFPQFRRKGYATRAVGLLGRAARVLGVRRLEAHIDGDNYPSLRVVERAGFVYGGLAKDQDADGVVRERTRWVLISRNRCD
jgi:RimJ/RimL family protein N-acetyltransferase